MRNLVDKPQPVTARIERLMQTVPGWTPADQLLALHLLATATAPLGGDILEVGSWCGRSTAILAHATQAAGIGRVWAVDLFPTKSDWQTDARGDHSFVVNINGRSIIGCEKPIWDEPFQRDIVPIYQRYDGILDAFQETMENEGVQQVVTPFVGTSEMFASTAPGDLKLRLAFLDGDHSYSSVCSDIDAAERFLMSGGWLCFDDAFAAYIEVDEAIRDRIFGSGRYELAHQISRKCFAARRK
jgi:predicted O-methyltransferase YrrM